MKDRIEAACAGFLITNGISFFLSLVMTARESEKNIQVIAIASIGAIAFLGAGIHLIKNGKYGRSIAIAVCALFTVPHLWTSWTVFQNFGLREAGSNLLSAAFVCTAITLIALVTVRIKDANNGA